MEAVRSEAARADETRRTHRKLTVAALLLGLFLAAMEMTVVATAMPTAIGDLGGIHLYAWVFAAYTLALTVTVPLYSKLGDLYGRKRFILVGMALFLAGSAASGQARTMSELIAFRGVQGLGAGALQPLTLTVVGDLFTLRERARIQGIFGAVWGFAGLAGPMLGGLLVKWLSWRWVFYVNVPFGLTSAVLLIVTYHERIERRPQRLDYAGALLLSAAVVALLLGSREHGLSLVWAAVSVACGALFVVAERHAADPVLPLRLFARRVMATSSAASVLVGAALLATVTFLPLYVQAVLGGSPTRAGSAISPMVIGWPIASAIAGRLLPRVGFRPLIVGGLAIAAGSAVAFTRVLHPGAPLSALQLASGFFGVGLGFANTALLLAVQNSVTWRERAVATGSTMFFRTIGGTVAVGLLGGVIAGRLAGVAGGSAAFDELLGPTHGAGLAPGAAIAMRQLLAAGLATVFHAIAIVALAALAVSLLFPRLAIGDVTHARERAAAAEGGGVP